MSVVSCPKCSGRVTLPPSSRDECWVRCPICRAEYQAHRLLDFAPPALELIDEPAQPFEGHVPTWDAVAAANAGAGSAPVMPQFATLGPDSVTLKTTDELAVAPAGGATGAFASAEADDDSNVFTFDDSLLLDEPTDELPRLPPTDFGQTTTHAGEPFADQLPSGDELEWQSADEIVPPPLVGNVSPPADAELRATEDHSSAVTVFDRGGAAPVTSVPQIGLAPRRRSRRRNPVLMVLGVVGGGFLGLVIGYAILMWLFDPPKDPLRIAPQLPGFMVPKSLRSAGESRVAQSTAGDEAGSGSATPNANGASDNDASKQAPPDSELFPPFEPPGEAPAESARSEAKPLADSKANPIEPPAEPAANDSARRESESLPDLSGDATKTATKSVAPDPLKNPFEAAASNELPAPRPATGNGGDPTSKVSTDATDPLGPVSERRFTRDELLAAVAAAKVTTQSALALAVNADAAEKRAVNGPFYKDLCKIAEALTYLDPSADKKRDDQATTAAIEAILNAAPDQARLEELGKLAGYWYERPQPTDKNLCKGIVLAGIVKQSKQRGKLVESVVETLGPPRELRIVSPAALTDDPSRPVLVIGAMIKDADKNLRGYDGAATTVVWAAMAIDPTAPSRAGAMP